ncbi:hypothetical protein [Phaeovulum vinaykumarii]|nr:hypothetical protein [Phaeovulum vinaykumarii]
MERAEKIGIGVSAALHGGLIIWVALGDWLFDPTPPEPIEIAEVSVISEAAFQQIVAAAPRAAETPAEPETPAPVAAAPEPEPEPAPQPDPEPAPEPLPDPQVAAPEPEPEAEPAPMPVLPPVAEPAPMLAPDISARPRPRPADRVAPVPSETPAPDAQTAETAVRETRPEESPAPDPEPPRPEAAPPEATTQIVTEDVETDDRPQSSAPRSSPRPPGRPARPDPAPETRTAAPAATPPAATPPARDTRDAVADALAEALAGSDDSTGGVGRAASGPPLTAGEREALVVAVKACWNVGALSSEALRTVVTVGFDMTPDGRPVNGSIAQLSYTGGSEAAAAQAFEAGRRAIIRCGASGFPLPPEKYDQWQRIEIVFNPEKMRMK